MNLLGVIFPMTLADDECIPALHPPPRKQLPSAFQDVFDLKLTFLQVGPFAQDEHLSLQSVRARCGKCVCMCG